MKILLITFIFIFVDGFAQAQNVDPTQTQNAPVETHDNRIQAKDLLEQFQRSDRKSESLSPSTLKAIKNRLQNSKMIGNEGAHGGDPYSLEFVTLGQILSQALDQSNPNSLAKFHFTAANFAKAVEAVRLVTVSRDDAILRGAEVDAINFPDENTILVNSDRWRELSIQSKTQLVLHEYFGILGVERDRFDVSIQFLSFTKKVAEAVSTNSKYSNLMVNVFYGQCNASPALTSPETCEQGSEALLNTEKCARAQAETHCSLSGKAHCQLLSTTYQPVIDPDLLGVRYCQVLTIMK